MWNATDMAVLKEARQIVEDQCFSDRTHSVYIGEDPASPGEPRVVVEVLTKLTAQQLKGSDETTVPPNLAVGGKLVKTAVIEAPISTDRRLRVGTAADVQALAAQAGLPQQNCYNSPIPGGVQIAPQGANWVGTLSCAIQYKDPSGVMRYGALTNYHVAVSREERGIRQLQPGGNSEWFGVLDRWSPMNFSSSGKNYVDGALLNCFRSDGKYAPGTDLVAPTQAEIGPYVPRPELNPTVGMEVIKSGRTTGVTKGKVVGLHSTTRVSYGNGVATFVDQMVLQGANGRDMSAPGDSVGGDSTLFYKVDGKLKYGTIADLYDELTPAEYLDEAGNKFRPAETVEVLSTEGLSVQRGKCVWRRVNWAYRHLTDKQCYRVRLRGGKAITVTSDHSLFATRGSQEAEEIRGSEITFDTQLLAAANQAAVGESESVGFDEGFWTIVGMYLGNGSMEKCGISISAGGKSEQLQFLREYVLGSARLLSGFERARRRLDDGWEGSPQELAVACEMSVPAVYTLLSRRRLGKDSRRERKAVYVNKKKDFRVNSTLLRDEIRSLNLGADAYTKRVPRWVITADLSTVAAVLRGYFSADGGVRFAKSRTPSVAAYSVNRGLLEDMQAMLWRLGIAATISDENTASSGFVPRTPTAHRLTIHRRDAIRLFADKVGLIGHGDRLQRCLAALPEDRARTERRDNYELESRQPLTIEKQLISQYVYDLSVTGERFIANGIVCHNSGSLIMTADLRPLCLLFAGGGGTTIANPIGYVLEWAQGKFVGQV